MVKFLISDGRLNVQTPDNRGVTCLRFAGRQARIDMMTFLLSMPDMNPTCPDSGGKTSLHIAAWWGSVKIITQLFKHKEIDVTVTDNDGLTVLHYTVRGLHADNFRRILDDPRIYPLATTNRGKTALDLA
jgi:ankyrin repeat protein